MQVSTGQWTGLTMLLVTGVLAIYFWSTFDKKSQRDSGTTIGQNLNSLTKVSTAGSVKPDPVQVDPAKADPISDLIGPLEKRLKENPDDASGWLLLGKSYEYLGETEKAHSAFQRAREFGSSDPTVLSLMTEPNAEPVATVIDSKTMLQVGRILDGNAKTVTPVEGVVISGQITIADELKMNIGPTHRVFVFAKRPDGVGVPLAVMQAKADQLPLSYRLDSSMAMIPGQSLNANEEIKITARVSMSGDVISQAGDLFAHSDVVTLAQQNTVNLTIDQIVQE